MKIVRKSAASGASQPRAQAWKLLVVDDEPDIRRLTTLNLTGFEFAGRPLQLLEAASAAEARQLLAEHPDLALALIDVVMESDDAGLKLVEYIRKTLGNRLIRLVIRTGQPGVAPERFVIDHFDIDDYKDKTELTAQKLYTTVRTALKGFRDLQTIELNRIGLARILDVTPELYNLHRDHLEEYFRGVLTQLIALCNLGHAGLISTIDGLLVTVENEALQIRAGAGEIAGLNAASRRTRIVELCGEAVVNHQLPEELRSGAVVVPLTIRDEVFGFVYLESAVELAQEDRELIQVMANQCAAALDNYRLHHSLEESYDQAIDMLGLVAEFKDESTGAHIRRIQEYTRRLALALGCTAGEAGVYAKASRLHDVGKVGIPDSVLHKPGQLNDEEFATIRQHTLIGDTILMRSPSLAIARVVARNHHEKWNGEGYPDGFSADDIPFVARIVAVVDVFDALISARPYKGAWTLVAAVDEIRRGIGEHFDPAVAKTFLEMIERGEVDDLIALSAQAAKSEAKPDNR